MGWVTHDDHSVEVRVEQSAERVGWTAEMVELIEVMAEQIALRAELNAVMN